MVGTRTDSPPTRLNVRAIDRWLVERLAPGKACGPWPEPARKDVRRVMVRSAVGIISVRVGAAEFVDPAIRGEDRLAARLPEWGRALCFGHVSHSGRSAIAHEYIEGEVLHRAASVPTVRLVLRLLELAHADSRTGPAPFPLLVPIDGKKSRDWVRIHRLYTSFNDAADSYPAPMSLIHGEPHTRNVIVRPDGTPALIDFEAVRVGCVLQDYGMLEAGLLYFGCTEPAAVVREAALRVAPRVAYRPWLTYALARHWSRRQSTAAQRAAVLDEIAGLEAT